jgi:Na+-transporting NADH:ubiquinone oxidoreductase subunit B
LKPLRKLLNNLKPNFEKGENWKNYFQHLMRLKLSCLYPIILQKNKGTHVRDAIDLKRTMIVVLSLVPCLLFGMWNIGYQHHQALGITNVSLMDNFIFGAIKVPLIIVSYGAGLTTEFILPLLENIPLMKVFSYRYVDSAIMPIDVPLWMLAVATILQLLTEGFLVEQE